MKKKVTKPSRDELLENLQSEGEVIIIKNEPIDPEIKSFLDAFSERYKLALQKGEEWCKTSKIRY